MARLTVNSILKLYSNIKASPENNTNVAFPSVAARESYFEKHKVYEKVVQIVKKTGNIRVSLRDIPGATLESCNYLSFINPNFDNKLYYARITKKDFRNDGTADVSYAIDWWMTDMFKATYSAMSIEREHMSQADAEKAATNPFSGDILELRTAEKGLGVSEDLEPLSYEITTDANSDGLYIMQSIMQALNYPAGMQEISMYIMMMAPIDFEEIEGAETYINNLKNMLSTSQYGFYVAPNSDDVITGITMMSDRKTWSSKLPNPYYTWGFTSQLTDKTYGLQPLIDKLTTWNCISSIIAIYAVPMSFMPFLTYAGKNFATAEPLKLSVGKTSKNFLGNVSPKLANYPFSYVTITSPSGDVKELRYENFKTVRDGSNKMEFYLLGDICEKPEVGIVPNDYKNTYGTGVVNPYGNFDEVLLFNQFATVAYISDAWLAQIAALSAQAIDNRTTQEMYNIGLQQLNVHSGTYNYATQMLGVADQALSGDLLGAVVDGLGAVIRNEAYRPGSDPLGSGNSMAQTALNLSKDITDQSVGALAGQQEGNVLYENYVATRPAHVAHNYHKSNGTGSILMNTAVNLDFKLIHHRLDTMYLNIYDRYFKFNGYTSGRYGIPRVVYFLGGTTAADKLPDWQSIDDTVKWTYIKTANAKISCEDEEAEVYISRMFNTGVRLLKGDELE